MAISKDELREKHKKIRLVMNSVEVRGKSRLICARFLEETDWTKVKTVHIYKSFNHLKEVDTNLIVQQLQDKQPQISVVLGTGRKDDKPPLQKFDLIVVPALGYDKDNHRLGWGGGWYDRFLAGQPQAYKIGLCFERGFIKQAIPHEAHDIPLDKIITEV